jgi:hypothetical protein
VVRKSDSDRVSVDDSDVPIRKRNGRFAGVKQRGLSLNWELQPRRHSRSVAVVRKVYVSGIRKAAAYPTHDATELNR